MQLDSDIRRYGRTIIGNSTGLENDSTNDANRKIIDSSTIPTYTVGNMAVGVPELICFDLPVEFAGVLNVASDIIGSYVLQGTDIPNPLLVNGSCVGAPFNFAVKLADIDVARPVMRAAELYSKSKSFPYTVCELVKSDMGGKFQWDTGYDKNNNQLYMRRPRLF